MVAALCAVASVLLPVHFAKFDQVFHEQQHTMCELLQNQTREWQEVMNQQARDLRTFVAAQLNHLAKRDRETAKKSPLAA